MLEFGYCIFRQPIDLRRTRFHFSFSGFSSQGKCNIGSAIPLWPRIATSAFCLWLIYLCTHSSVRPSVHRSIHRSIHPSIHNPFHPSIHPSAYKSTHMSKVSKYVCFIVKFSCFLSENISCNQTCALQSNVYTYRQRYYRIYKLSVICQMYSCIWFCTYNHSNVTQQSQPVVFISSANPFAFSRS